MGAAGDLIYSWQSKVLLKQRKTQQWHGIFSPNGDPASTSTNQLCLLNYFRHSPGFATAGTFIEGKSGCSSMGL